MKKVFLAVGLGNPEGKYFQTYHNVGFLCCELLASKITGNGLQEMGEGIFKKKGNLSICDFNVGGNKVFLLKPLTYMNNSGQAVVAVTRKYKIAPENIIVFVDDLYIDKGKIRITVGGSHAGHNGIKSINELLGTNQYTKIKVGIKPLKAVPNQADYVLSRIDVESQPLLNSAFEKGVDAAFNILRGEAISKMQNVYNSTNVVVDNCEAKND